jgi:hypothetical protein
MKSCPPRQFRSGFTAVEMFMGMMITTLVLGAMAAFCMAMSSAFSSAGKSQLITLKAQQIANKITSEIRAARLLGACRLGSSDGSASGAALMIWKHDTNGDGYIQGNEVEMLYHDTTAHTLDLYYTGQSDAVGTWSYSTNFTAAAVIDQFKIGRSSTVIGNGVYGAVFQTSGTSGTTYNPSFQFALKLMVDDTQATSGSSAVGGDPKQIVHYGTTTVRAPIAAPAN